MKRRPGSSFLCHSSQGFQLMWSTQPPKCRRSEASGVTALEPQSWPLVSILVETYQLTAALARANSVSLPSLPSLVMASLSLPHHWLCSHPSDEFPDLNPWPAYGSSGSTGSRINSGRGSPRWPATPPSAQPKRTTGIWLTPFRGRWLLHGMDGRGGIPLVVLDGLDISVVPPSAARARLRTQPSSWLETWWICGLMLSVSHSRSTARLPRA